MNKAADVFKKVIKQGIRIFSLSYTMAILICVPIHHGWLGKQLTITEVEFFSLSHYFILLIAGCNIITCIIKGLNTNMGTAPLPNNSSVALEISSTNRSSRQLYCDAIHEAAHAVIAEKLGLSVKEVTLQPTEGTCGHMKLEEPEDGFCSLRTVEARIKICMAGILAEYIICQNLNNGGNMENSDLSQIEELINLYLLHTDDETILIPSYGYQERIRERAKELNLKCRKETKELILQNQEEIKKKAQKLIEDYRRN